MIRAPGLAEARADAVPMLLARGWDRVAASTRTEATMSTPERRGGIGGISLGGIIVIIGIVVALFWSVLIGVILVLIGLIAFGGFARGRWY